MTRLVDLSHELATGMPVYPGDPVVELGDAAVGEPWRVSRLALGSHSGTHIDAAAHYVRGGRTIDEYPLERFVLPAVVAIITAGAGEEIGRDVLGAALALLPAGGALLLATGWDRHWGGAGMLDHPWLGAEACGAIVAAGVGLVGTDAFNVDDSAAGTTHAHEILLGADVLIVENLRRLSEFSILAAGRTAHCAFVPLRLAGGDGSPIRAYGWTD